MGPDEINDDDLGGEELYFEGDWSNFIVINMYPSLYTSLHFSQNRLRFLLRLILSIQSE